GLLAGTSVPPSSRANTDRSEGAMRIQLMRKSPTWGWSGSALVISVLSWAWNVAAMLGGTRERSGANGSTPLIIRTSAGASLNPATVTSDESKRAALIGNAPGLAWPAGLPNADESIGWSNQSIS